MTRAEAGTDRRWVSVYLYYARRTPGTGGIYTPDCDRVVREWVAPLVSRFRRERLASGAFFVRYTDRGGPHVRLRVLPAAAPALASIREGIADAARSRWGEDALAWVDYEPELERYGGAAAMPIGEQCFVASTATALEMLASLPEPRAARLGRGLVALLALVHAFLPDEVEAAEFAESYSTGYLRALSTADPAASAAWRAAFDRGYDRQADALAGRIREVWSLLTAEEEREPILDRWYAGVSGVRDALRELVSGPGIQLAGQSVRDWRAAVWHILPSYIHMTSNRLGVSIPEESYLARAVSRTFRSVAV